MQSWQKSMFHMEHQYPSLLDLTAIVIGTYIVDYADSYLFLLDLVLIKTKCTREVMHTRSHQYKNQCSTRYCGLVQAYIIRISWQE